MNKILLYSLSLINLVSARGRFRNFLRLKSQRLPLDHQDSLEESREDAYNGDRSNIASISLTATFNTCEEDTLPVHETIHGCALELTVFLNEDNDDNDDDGLNSINLQESQTTTTRPTNLDLQRIAKIRGGDDQNAPFLYSEFTSDFEPENDSFVENEQMTDTSDSASIVGSSQMYENGCFVSAEAMVFRSDSFRNWLDSANYDDQDDDDDDDDDDDGHSSMLSNNSLRTSKVYAGASNVPSTKAKHSNPTTTEDMYYGEVRLQKQQLFGLERHCKSFLKRN